MVVWGMVLKRYWHDFAAAAINPSLPSKQDKYRSPQVSQPWSFLTILQPWNSQKLEDPAKTSRVFRIDVQLMT